MEGSLRSSATVPRWLVIAFVNTPGSFISPKDKNSGADSDVRELALSLIVVNESALDGAFSEVLLCITETVFAAWITAKDVPEVELSFMESVFGVNKK